MKLFGHGLHNVPFEIQKTTYLKSNNCPKSEVQDKQIKTILTMFFISNSFMLMSFNEQYKTSFFISFIILSLRNTLLILTNT